MASLKLEDFSDRELLFAFEDHADEDGLVTSQGLAEGLGLNEAPTRNVAIRLSWLKRYGVVYRDQDANAWGLTEIGRRVLHGGLTTAQRRALGNVDDDDLFAIMSEVGGKIMGAHAEAAILTERQWRYNFAQRKREARMAGRFM